MKIDAQIKDSIGKINIVDTISENTNSNSNAIRDIIDDFIKNKVTDIEVYLNSKGGSVFEASEIVNQLKRINNVTVIVGSIAASAATFIMANFKNKSNENSKFMIHRPSVVTQGDVKKVKSDLKLLENITEDYKNAYVLKMKKTPEQIEEIFDKGDYWMTAKEAQKEGLLDEIIIDAMPKSVFEASSSEPVFSAKVTEQLASLSDSEKEDFIQASKEYDFRNKKDDIYKGMIFNPHNIKKFDALTPSERLEILYSVFEMVNLRTDNDTFFKGIVEKDDQIKANEWVNSLSASERKDFQEVFNEEYNIFSKKPSNI